MTTCVLNAAAFALALAAFLVQESGPHSSEVLRGTLAYSSLLLGAVIVLRQLMRRIRR